MPYRNLAEKEENEKMKMQMFVPCILKYDLNVRNQLSRFAIILKSRLCIKHLIIFVSFHFRIVQSFLRVQL